MDRFVASHNEVRPHRVKGRKTPKRARSTHATKPDLPSERAPFTTGSIARGVVTIRYKSKLHHIGMGRALAGTRIVLLVGGRMIRVIDQDGQTLRNLELDPSRN